LVLELIRELEADRAKALEAAEPPDMMIGKIAALQRLRGIGDNFAAVLTREYSIGPSATAVSSPAMSVLHRCPTKVAAWIATGKSVEPAILEPVRP
jgi:hypothetical protein